MSIHEELVQINRYAYNKYYDAYKRVEERDKDIFNKDLLEEIETLKNENNELYKKIVECKSKIYELKNRNLIQRIINK